MHNSCILSQIMLAHITLSSSYFADKYSLDNDSAVDKTEHHHSHGNIADNDFEIKIMWYMYVINSCQQFVHVNGE